MDDKKSPPVVFANRVIRQMVDHILAEDMVMIPNDYIAIRTAFRTNGGLWAPLIQGDIKQLELLLRVVSAWGALPEREKESDRIV